MRGSLSLFLALPLVLGGAACTGGDPAAVSSADAEEGSIGVLHVERLSEEVAGDGARRTALRAAFARYRGVDGRSVVTLLGSGPAAEIESCAWSPAGSPHVSESAEVELLDVGTIRVRVAGTETRLVPRAFPDLASVLAGVFYAGESSASGSGLAVPRPDLDEYTFQASGSAEVPGFEAVVPAPAEPAEIRVDGVPATEPRAITRDAGLDLAWSAGDPRDVIEIEIRAGGEVLACAARDDGGFRVEPAALATLSPDPRGTLVIRRVRVTPVDVPELHDAFARIAVTRALDVDVR
jgi:hypothetical protein